MEVGDSTWREGGWICGKYDINNSDDVEGEPE